MILSDKKKFIFIHIYKNAGTSIQHALLSEIEPKWFFNVYSTWDKFSNLKFPFHDPSPFDNHIKAQDLKNKIGDKKFNSYFSFAFVRNPWDWQVSLYKYMLKNENHRQHNLIKKLGSFENYIRWRCNNEVRFQKDFIYSKNNELLVDFVGRYEKLEEDFEKVCQKIGVESNLPKLNVSNKISYTEFYNEETKNLVRKTFKPDIELFDYSFK